MAVLNNRDRDFIAHSTSAAGMIGFNTCFVSYKEFKCDLDAMAWCGIM